MQKSNLFEWIGSTCEIELLRDEYREFCNKNNLNFDFCCDSLEAFKQLNEFNYLNASCSHAYHPSTFSNRHFLHLFSKRKNSTKRHRIFFISKEERKKTCFGYNFNDADTHFSQSIFIIFNFSFCHFAINQYQCIPFMHQLCSITCKSLTHFNI